MNDKYIYRTCRVGTRREFTIMNEEITPLSGDMKSNDESCAVIGKMDVVMTTTYRLDTVDTLCSKLKAWVDNLTLRCLGLYTSVHVTSKDSCKCKDGKSWYIEASIVIDQSDTGIHPNIVFDLIHKSLEG